jgi:hypothetical protein
MRADICEPDDTAAMERFRTLLKSRGAELLKHEWAIGVDLWQFRIGDETVHVFSDAWSVDIEGPPELIRRLVAGMHESDS